MFQLILGRAGSGKTTRLYGEIDRVTAAGRKAILLVPEQYSFESEKELYHRLGPQRAAHVEVLSFRRLCNSIFRTYGGLAAPPLSDVGRHVLMGIALEEVADRLQVYGRQSGKAAFIGEMVATVSELKTAGVTPEALQAPALLEHPALQRKTADIGLIYQTYQSLIQQSYSDGDDDILRALELLEPQAFFGQTTVFIDSFTAFMAGEYKLLAAVLAGAQEVYAAFTCDGLAEREGGLGVFSAARETASRLLRMAGESGRETPSPILLEEDHRHESDALYALERGFLQRHSQEEVPQDGSVLSVAAADVYEECIGAAASIAADVRERGWRYRDIAVICRDLSPYEVALPRVFQRYGIPYFMDSTIGAQNTPTAAVIAAALACVQTSLATEQVLRFAKCAAVGLPREQVAQLENYCYIWSIERGDWLHPFCNHPDGLREGLDERARTTLEKLNGVREQVTAPLTHLRERLKGADGLGFAQAVYELLEEIGAAEHLLSSGGHLPAQEREQYLDTQSSLWDAVMELLQVIAQTVGHRRMETARYAELFALGVSAIQIGVIPQTLDQVIVGMADRIRPGRVKAVYLLGAQSGVFPADSTPVGLFSDSERQQLIHAGIEVSQTAQIQVVREKSYAYLAVAAPSQKLWVSYAASSLQGETATPSVIVSEVQAILGIKPIPAAALDWQDHIVNPDTALAEFSAASRVDDVRRATLAELTARQLAELQPRMEQGSSADYHMADPRTAKALFGSSMRLSPSQIESFYSCAFAYYCTYGLRLRRREKADFNPMESGNVTHFVLQQLVDRYGGRGLLEVEEEALRREIREIIDRYLASKVQDSSTLPKRFYYLYTRLVDSLVHLIRRLGEEFAQSLFEPIAFEMEIGSPDTLPALHLQSPDGVDVYVSGKVDRVDMMERPDGSRYVRIVDYKTGTKKFALSDVVQGLNMQMLIYLFTIQQNGRGRLEGALPAGVLYMPSSSRYVSGDRHTPAEEVQAAQRKTYRMSGLLLDDVEIIQGMEKEIRGVFIPAKQKKDGGWDAYSSVATLAELGRLSHRIEQNITSMADLLGRGYIPALPIDGGGYRPCDYCRFATVCGREEEHPVRHLESWKNREVFDMIGEEEPDVR